MKTLKITFIGDNMHFESKGLSYIEQLGALRHFEKTLFTEHFIKHGKPKRKKKP